MRLPGARLSSGRPAGIRAKMEWIWGRPSKEKLMIAGRQQRRGVLAGVATLGALFAMATRQMPPWHIDRSVGVQKLKNDMSLSDDQMETIVRWVDQGAPQGDPKDLPPPKPLVTDNEWKAVRDGFGPPDLVVKSSEYTMPAQHQDVWYRPMSDIPLAESRWVKLVEIRPTNLKSRKIIHHSIAYLVLNNDPEAVNTGTASGPDRNRFGDDDIVNRRPQLMEWAIGKGYDLFRPGTGKL